ncbi:hypothetical protein [Ruania alba]|uniref:hypothetical protein n=1 Tax=Ruania alba TaxID=648782 RepID=UPI003CCB994A
MSRATLARRFTDLVGEPPMTYLTGWRLTLAADLLRGSDEPSRPSPAGWGTERPSRSAVRSSAATG